MKFVATKTVEQLDLQALHRVRERLVSQRTGIINQIRAFLLERGVAVHLGEILVMVSASPRSGAKRTPGSCRAMHAFGSKADAPSLNYPAAVTFGLG